MPSTLMFFFFTEVLWKHGYEREWTALIQWFRLLGEEGEMSPCTCWSPRHPWSLQIKQVFPWMNGLNLAWHCIDEHDILYGYSGNWEVLNASESPQTHHFGLSQILKTFCWILIYCVFVSYLLFFCLFTLQIVFERFRFILQVLFFSLAYTKPFWKASVQSERKQKREKVKLGIFHFTFTFF